MNKKSAFSLLELIFAIVIIGVIASVAIPKFMDTKADAKASTIKQDINTTVTTVRSYIMVGNTFSKFDDVLTLNKNSWIDTDKTTMKFVDGESDCITISVSDSQLIVEIAEDNENTICAKLESLGIVDSTYELN